MTEGDEKEMGLRRRGRVILAVGWVVVLLGCYESRQIEFLNPQVVSPPFPPLPPLKSAPRIFAVGYRLNLDAYASPETFYEDMERMMEEIKPYLAPDAPNLIAFPEEIGFPLMVTGPKGAKVREAKTMEEAVGAFLELAGTFSERISFYMNKYPGISAGRGFFLAMTDVALHPFMETFSSLAREYNAYIIACTNVPKVTISSDPADVSTFGDPDYPERDYVYLPVDANVYNTAYLFAPDGTVIGEVRKVHLTDIEGPEGLDLSAGDLGEVEVFDTAIGKVCIGVCYDAFFDSYRRWVDEKGCRILVQPSANGQMWAYPAGSGVWQPEEWLLSTAGSVQNYQNIEYNVNPMLTGSFLFLVFDGQSAIIKKTDYFTFEPFYVGTPSLGELGYKGEFAALAPWVVQDPVFDNPALTLDERRRILMSIAEEVMPGSGSPLENSFVEAIIWTEIEQ